MGEITTGAELKGITVRAILKDGVPRDLDFDFEAQCLIEETMRGYGMRPEVEQARLLKEQVDKAAAEAAGTDYVPEISNDGPGYFRSMGIFAYALTASWRADNGEGDMTYKQFAKLLPARPPAALHSWTSAVNRAMASETDESPNGEGPVVGPPLDESSETPASDSGSLSPPTGTSSGIAAEPSSESAQSESSGG